MDRKKAKKVLPFVGLGVLAGLGTLGFMKRDNIIYNIYKKTYKHQVKKENITPYS